MSFDLKQSQAIPSREDDGTVVRLADETGEKMFAGTGDAARPVTWTVAGTYSKRYRRATAANRDRLFKRRSAQMDGDTAEQQALGVIAACTLGWDGIESDGTPLPSTPENIIAVLEAAPWIREQVEAAMNDHALFFARS